MDRPAKKLIPQTPGWVLAGLLGMACAAVSSGIQPWAAAIAGAFVFPADLAADSAAAHLFVQRISPYDPVIRKVHENLTGLPLALTLPHFPHPPFSLIITFPLGYMSFRAAATVWFAATMALLFALAVLIHKAVSRSEGERGVGVAQMWLLLLAWPPVLYNLEKGQWSVLVAVLLALAWRAVTLGHVQKGAMWAAVASSVKVFPVILGSYFLMRSVRAAGLFAATGLVLLGIPLLWIGFGSLPAFVHESRLNLPYWESFPLVMFSIHGAITRFLVGGRWAEPFVHAPMLARVMEAVLIVGLLALAAHTTLQARRARVDHAMAFLVWLILLPLLNPLSMGHNGVLLALPIVVLGRMLARTGSNWHRWGWALAVSLVSVPSQTVWRFTTLPVGPVEGLAVAALPTWGGLLLFLIVVSLARAPSAISQGCPVRWAHGSAMSARPDPHVISPAKRVIRHVPARLHSSARHWRPGPF